MKLREIIKLSSDLLNLEDVLNGEKIYDETYDVLDDETLVSEGTLEDRTISLLVKCFNLVYSEIATDYLQLITFEDIEVEDEKFFLSNLENKFYKLIKVENEFGISVPFKVYDDILYLNNGKYKIYYAYIPSQVSLNSEVNNFNGKLSVRLFAFGLSKEYCFISGLYNDASLFKTRFEEGLFLASKEKKNIIMPGRRWK
ncbi:MAG: hypothetical protein ACI4T1_00770 [Christensenellales bacterium]